MPLESVRSFPAPVSFFLPFWFRLIGRYTSDGSGRAGWGSISKVKVNNVEDSTLSGMKVLM